VVDDDTIGRGWIVVCSLLVVVRVIGSGPPQAANVAMPASSAAPNASLKPDA
jgi:hypothetical protein